MKFLTTITTILGLIFIAAPSSTNVQQDDSPAKIMTESSEAILSSEPFLGQIIMFAGNFPPRGWAFCNGQVLDIANNQALFSILGTTYGGDGRTNFALPDLRGRVPVHAGNGPGLSSYSLGDKGGLETQTLTVNNLPAHSHTVNAVSADGNKATPNNTLPAATKILDPEYSSEAPSTTMSDRMIGTTGSGQAVDIRQPYGTVNYIIALVGTFPSRN